MLRINSVQFDPIWEHTSGQISKPSDKSGIKLIFRFLLQAWKIIKKLITVLIKNELNKVMKIKIKAINSYCFKKF